MTDALLGKGGDALSEHCSPIQSRARRRLCYPYQYEVGMACPRGPIPCILWLHQSISSEGNTWYIYKIQDGFNFLSHFHAAQLLQMPLLLICRRCSGGPDDIHGCDVQRRLRDAGCVLPLHLRYLPPVHQAQGGSAHSTSCDNNGSIGKP